MSDAWEFKTNPPAQSPGPSSVSWSEVFGQRTVSEEHHIPGSQSVHAQAPSADPIHPPSLPRRGLATEPMERGERKNTSAKPPRKRLSPARDSDWQAIYAHFQQGLCWLCKKPGCESWHHLDHNRSNWDPANVRRVHLSCNQSEYNLWKASQPKISLPSAKGEREEIQIRAVNESRNETRNISWESSRSLELGPTFDKELRRLLAESKLPGSNWIPTVKNVENRLAKICDCGQAVVGRWIDKEATTPEGDYKLSARTISDGRKKRTAQIIELKEEPGFEYDLGSLEHPRARAARMALRYPAIRDGYWTCERGHRFNQGDPKTPSQCPSCGTQKSTWVPGQTPDDDQASSEAVR